ncbi:hypothetical protein T439DRAFT_324414 [Meredithblackwellia eburnea MCA 4105]
MAQNPYDPLGGGGYGGSQGGNYQDPYAPRQFAPTHQQRRSEGGNPFRDAAAVGAPALDLPGNHEYEDENDEYGGHRDSVLQYGSRRPDYGDRNSSYGGGGGGDHIPMDRFDSHSRHTADTHGDYDYPDEDGDAPLLGGDGGVGRQFDEDRARRLHQQQYDAPEDGAEEEEEEEEEESPEATAAREAREKEAKRAEDEAMYGGFVPGERRERRRFKTIKSVPLYNGNIVLDNQRLPSKLLDQLPDSDDPEVTTVRYTMATCDPNDFQADGYNLRQRMYPEPRHTELFIVITMYNENDELLGRSLFGVFEGLQHMMTRKERPWSSDERKGERPGSGRQGWQNVVICIVADGRAKVSPRALDLLAALGVYQGGLIQHGSTGMAQRPPTAHIFEHTTRMMVDKSGGVVKGPADCPVQMLFCLKENNAKKINSHRWFFNAFAPILDPSVCILLDAGTRPMKEAVYRLWKTFDLYANVGGCCGEIVAQKSTMYKNLLNPVIATQNFEYKMSNILDKPLESVFGYITVLPGAFSAYRYRALLNDSKGKGPLREYFLGEVLHHDPNASLWTKNMYLAEDRILCWELVSKRDSSWLLHYQRSAKGVTDVPSSITGLIDQRRRWLNGSFFAAIHAIFHFTYLYRSSHRFMTKFWLHVELVYQVFQMIFAWFGLGNFFIIYFILSNSLVPLIKSGAIPIINSVTMYLYIGCLVMSYLMAMGNKPSASPFMYTFVVVCYAIITVYMLFAAVYVVYSGIAGAVAAHELSVINIFANCIYRDMVISIASTYGLYYFASFISLQPWHMFTCFLQYLLMAASYINVINVYAFCNVQDVTWGNRPEEKAAGGAAAKVSSKNTVEVTLAVDPNEAYSASLQTLSKPEPPEQKEVDTAAERKAAYDTIRTNVVLAWTLSNGILVGAILSGGTTTLADPKDKCTQTTRSGAYMIFLLYAVAILAFVRTIGCTVYMITWLRNFKK